MSQVSTGSPGSSARVHGWVDPALRERFPDAAEPAALLERLRSLVPSEWLRRRPERATFVWPGAADLVVKRLVGSETLRERWLERRHGSGGGGRSPAQREAENLAGLTAEGVRVPRPLAWASEADGRGALVMERVAAGTDLASALASADRSRAAELCDELVVLVARMHRAGWYHRDLYLHHLRLVADGLCLFDVGRARREARPRERWLVKDLAALASTLPANFPRAEWPRFLARWCAVLGRGAPSAAFERRIARKAARMSAHRPRWIEPGGRLDGARAAPRAGGLTSAWDPRSATS